MKEGGIIATSFTIYPNEENGRENFKGELDEEEGARFVSCRLLFQFKGVISAQIDVILTGNSLILD